MNFVFSLKKIFFFSKQHKEQHSAAASQKKMLSHDEVVVEWKRPIARGSDGVILPCKVGDVDRVFKVPFDVYDLIQALWPYLLERQQLSEFLLGLAKVWKGRQAEEDEFGDEWRVNRFLRRASTLLLQQKSCDPPAAKKQRGGGAKEEEELMRQHLGYSTILEFDHLVEGSFRGIIMERCKESLFQHCSRGRLDLGRPEHAPEWKRLLRSVLAGLRYMAVVGGLRHVDMKADNVLLSRGGEWRIMDFGLARCSDDPIRDYALDVTMFAQRLFIDNHYGPEVVKSILALTEEQWMLTLYQVAYYSEPASWADSPVPSSQYNFIRALEKQLFTTEEMDEMDRVEMALAAVPARAAYAKVLEASILKYDMEELQDNLRQRPKKCVVSLKEAQMPAPPSFPSSTAAPPCSPLSTAAPSAHALALQPCLPASA